MNATAQNQATKVSKDTFKMIIENKELNLVKIAQTNKAEKDPTIFEIWEAYCVKLDKKEAIAKKRALNPTVTKLVGEQKRENEAKYKSDAKNVLIGTKALLKQIKEKDLSIFENEELIKKCNTFVNYITNVKNIESLNLFLTFAMPTKNGFFSESNFSNIIQKITKISIDKNKNFEEAVNYFEALRKAKK